MLRTLLFKQTYLWIWEMTGEIKDIAIKSSTDWLEEYRLPTYKTRKWASVKSLQKIVVFRQTFSWIWELAEEEITWMNSQICILCGFKIWFNFELLRLRFDKQFFFWIFQNNPVLVNMMKRFSLVIQYKLWLNSKFLKFLSSILLSDFAFFNKG